jgi:serine/threonine protein phosphatase PrpC
VLCTDGLTKHVPDERIGEVLAMSTAGGSDNVSVVVARTEEPNVNFVGAERSATRRSL